MVSPREAIIRNGLPPALVDDPLFRKTLVTTSRMGQTSVCMVKGTALGKRDTTLPHRQNSPGKLFRRLTRGWMKRTSGVKKDIWSVMKDFAKTPGGKDFSKMKSQYQMFVDTVGSKQVTV